jgi:hypothetical protein
MLRFNIRELMLLIRSPGAGLISVTGRRWIGDTLPGASTSRT